MGDTFLPILLLLLVLSFFFQDSYIFILIYLFAGSYALGRWWSRKALAAVEFRRELIPRIFPGQELSVRLTFKNTGWLPIVWLQFSEALPVELGRIDGFRKVLTIGPYGSAIYEYSLVPKKRGYYTVGPVRLHSGDVMGMMGEAVREGKSDSLVVYPHVVALSKLVLPSRSPMGNLRHHLPIFEDPTRITGKREYVAGDSLRRIDWKSTAVTGQLQVKLFEPSIALETVLFLNLNQSEYRLQARIDASELAIVVAASIASWLAGQKQPAGLITNGLDPLEGEGEFMKPIPPKKGRGHMMRILEALARVKAGETTSFVDLVQRERVFLPWGATAIYLVNTVPEGLFEEIHQARQTGLNAVLVACGRVAGLQEIKIQSEFYRVPVFHIQDETDLDIWR
jgi:uncharacterized protein (DUF58 family)